MSELTELQKDLLRHTLGARKDQSKKNRGYRNYFLASEGSDHHRQFLAMSRLGFAEEGAICSNGQYFRATPAGCKAIGLKRSEITRAFSK